MQITNRQKLLLTIAGIWLVLLLLNSLSSNAAMKTLPYSEFLRLAKEGKITEVAVTDNVIQGVMLDENSNSGRREPFRTVRVDSEVSEVLDQNGIEYTVKYNRISSQTFFLGFFRFYYFWGSGTSSCDDFNNNRVVL